MRRLSTLWLAMTWMLVGMPQALAPHPPEIPARASLNSITVADSPVGKEILLQIDGEYSFQTVREPEGALCVELHGPRIGTLSPSAHWAKGPLAGYQLIEYTDANGRPVVRMEIQTRGSAPLSAERGSSGLRLLLGQSAPASGAPAPLAIGSESSRDKTTAGPTFVSAVLLSQESSGEVTIDVATTKSATFHVYQFDRPNRLVVDLEGARNRFRLKSIPVSSPVMKDVRVGQFREQDPEVVRVVADLSGNPVFDTHAYEGGVRIEVKPRRPAASQPVAPPPAPKPEAAAQRAEGKPIQQAAVVPARQIPAPPARPAASAAPQPQTGVNPKRSVAVVSSPARIKETTRPGYDGALPALEKAVQIPPMAPADAALNGRAASAHAATPEVLRAERAAQVLTESASNLSDVQDAVPAGSAPPSEQKPAYTGEPISLNLKDVDLKDFFRLIHEISGLNILVDPNVTGSVTTVLDNVPWDQALDIVLKDNGLGEVLQGNILRIARLDTLIAEQETANRMAAARLESAPLVTVFRPLNYAKASILRTLLNSWGSGKERERGGGALSARGSVMIDDRTNTLIISDIASQMPIVQKIIDRLDTRTKQVAIEARIVLASSSFQRTLGAALLGSISNPSGSTIGAAQTGTGSSVSPSTTGKPSFTITPNPTTGFGVVAITNFSQRYMIDAAISAAEIRSQAKTISRPSIITQNNAEGRVQQGTQIPVQTSINNTIAVQYVNATLQLTVTPQVTDDGHIFMKLDVQNANPGTIITNAAVSIDIQQATTSVLVPDGGTVVFGGVTVTLRQNSSTGIPLLGNIPILGNLFKTSNIQDSDQELLFFVSPRLLATT